MTDQARPRPCPFCKSKNIEDDSNQDNFGGIATGCNDCGASGPHLEPEDREESHAVAKWNRRPIEDRLLARVEELEKALMKIITFYDRAVLPETEWPKTIAIKAISDREE